MAAPRTPGHLSRATAKWWRAVARDYDLADHHLHLLTLACEALDRCTEARQVLEREGLTYVDRWGQPKARPEVAVERDSRQAAAALIRQLGLDDDEDDLPPPSPPFPSRMP